MLHKVVEMNKREEDNQLSIFDYDPSGISEPEFIRDHFSRYDNPIDGYESIGKLHEQDTEAVKIFNTNARKHHGVYYTPYVLAFRIINESIDSSQLDYDKTFLEPCVGSGMFVIAYVDFVFKQLKVSNDNDAQRIVDNIYYSDVDEKAIRLFTAAFAQYVQLQHGFNVQLKKENAYIGNGLFKQKVDRIEKIDLREMFGKYSGFDYVFTNPPYKLLKANSNKYNGDLAEKHKKELVDVISFLKRSKSYPYSQGTLNLYKLFVEDIVTRYVSADGVVGLLIPQTLLNDKQSTALRKMILRSFNMTRIYIIPEKAKFFTGINQAFCLFGLQATQSPRKVFEVVDSVMAENDLDKKGYVASVEDLESISSEDPIVATDQAGFKLLKKIHAHPSIKEIKNITNLRGELDLTLNRKSIVDTETPYRLVRGAHIGDYNLRSTKDYVDKHFLEITAKRQYITAERIACQQISNMQTKYRLKFALVPKNFVLANSTNFIAVNEGQSQVSLRVLYAILSSSLLNWRFRMTSSNNHINNYELDDLPIPSRIDPDSAAELEKIIDDTTIPSSQKREAIDEIVEKIYRLTKKERSYIKG